MMSLRGLSVLGLSVAMTVGMTVGMAAGPTGLAHAEQRQATPPPPAAPVSSSPDRLASALFRGPSLYETGRVGKMGLSEAGVQIRQTRTRTVMQEPRVQPKTEVAAVTQHRAAGGNLDPEVLGREIKSRFALLRECKVEVARHRRVAPAAVAGSRLTLRWTVLPDGHVGDTQVVATSRVDGRVMNCMKRQMSVWSFSPPVGGSVRVERPFAFR